MINLNKVTLIGNITRDIEIKALPSGQSVVSFGLATNRTWKDKDGQKQEQAEFHNVVSFGKQADTINQYCKKGDQLFIEGRLQTRSWEDKTTNEKMKLKDILKNIKMTKEELLNKLIELKFNTHGYYEGVYIPPEILQDGMPGFGGNEWVGVRNILTNEEFVEFLFNNK